MIPKPASYFKGAQFTPMLMRRWRPIAALRENSSKSRFAGALQRISDIANARGHIRHARSYSFQRYSPHRQHCPPSTFARASSGTPANGSKVYAVS